MKPNGCKKLEWIVRRDKDDDQLESIERYLKPSNDLVEIEKVGETDFCFHYTATSSPNFIGKFTLATLVPFLITYESAILLDV